MGGVFKLDTKETESRAKVCSKSKIERVSSRNLCLDEELHGKTQMVTVGYLSLPGLVLLATAFIVIYRQEHRRHVGQLRERKLIGESTQVESVTDEITLYSEVVVEEKMKLVEHSSDPERQQNKLESVRYSFTRESISPSQV